MNAGSVCKRGVVTVTPSDDLIAAAHMMREKHVGYLIDIAGSIRNEQRMERAVRQ